MTSEGLVATTKGLAPIKRPAETEEKQENIVWTDDPKFWRSIIDKKETGFARSINRTMKQAYRLMQLEPRAKALGKIAHSYVDDSLTVGSATYSAREMLRKDLVEGKQRSDQYYVQRLIRSYKKKPGKKVNPQTWEKVMTIPAKEYVLMDDFLKLLDSRPQPKYETDDEGNMDFSKETASSKRARSRWENKVDNAPEIFARLSDEWSGWPAFAVNMSNRFYKRPRWDGPAFPATQHRVVAASYGGTRQGENYTFKEMDYSGAANNFHIDGENIGKIEYIDGNVVRSFFGPAFTLDGDESAAEYYIWKDGGGNRTGLDKEGNIVLGDDDRRGYDPLAYGPLVEISQMGAKWMTGEKITRKDFQEYVRDNAEDWNKETELEFVPPGTDTDLIYGAPLKIGPREDIVGTTVWEINPDWYANEIKSWAAMANYDLGRIKLYREGAAWAGDYDDSDGAAIDENAILKIRKNGFEVLGSNGGQFDYPLPKVLMRQPEGKQPQVGNVAWSNSQLQFSRAYKNSEGKRIVYKSRKAGDGLLIWRDKRQARRIADIGRSYGWLMRTVPVAGGWVNLAAKRQHYQPFDSRFSEENALALMRAGVKLNQYNGKDEFSKGQGYPKGSFVSEMNRQKFPKDNKTYFKRRRMNNGRKQNG